MNTRRILLISLGFLSALTFILAAGSSCDTDVTKKCPDNTTCCSYKRDDVRRSYCFALTNGICCEGPDNNTPIYACTDKQRCKADKTGCEGTA